MADDTLRQEIPGVPAFHDGGEPIKMTGRMPPAMQQALREVRAQKQNQTGQPTADQPPATQARPTGSAQLEELIEGLRDKSSIYEDIKLPSGGAFYNGTDGPEDGSLSIRPMTGEEEQILATPRYVKKGQAINMIFQRCLKQNVRPENLLSVDRTYLLIWLRGISYGHEYEVEVKCPECERKFGTTIDLNALVVNPCPNDFRPPLTGVLPKSGYKFNYHLSRGKDENAVQEYRDRHLRMFGDTGADDTLIYRTALLLDDIEGLTNKNELVMLLKKLPIQDVAHLRNLITDPPFGVDTKVPINCPGCLCEFEVDLPLEANFFFPRKRREKTPA